MQANPWFYTHTGQRQGPVSDDEIRQLIIERKFSLTPVHSGRMT
ncbi:GYF domain-containing protein [Rubritalea sp.]